MLLAVRISACEPQNGQGSSLSVIMTASCHYQGERKYPASSAHNERYEMSEHADH